MIKRILMSNKDFLPPQDQTKYLIAFYSVVGVGVAWLAQTISLKYMLYQSIKHNIPGDIYNPTPFYNKYQSRSIRMMALCGILLCLDFKHSKLVSHFEDKYFSDITDEQIANFPRYKEWMSHKIRNIGSYKFGNRHY